MKEHEEGHDETTPSSSETDDNDPDYDPQTSILACSSTDTSLLHDNPTGMYFQRYM